MLTYCRLLLVAPLRETALKYVLSSAFIFDVAIIQPLRGKMGIEVLVRWRGILFLLQHCSFKNLLKITGLQAKEEMDHDFST